MNRLFSTVSPAVILLVLFPLCASSQKTSKRTKAEIPVSEADDCSLTFSGSARRDVKLRTAQDGSHYESVNNGDSLTVAEWLKMTCSQFDPKVIEVKDVPIPGIETQKVSLQGYLVAARFENGAKGDYDIHAEISDNPNWPSPHVIVEVPPGEAYCSARKELWSLVKSDLLPGKNTAIPSSPPQVKVTGYVFLDTAHGGSHFCTANGGRGIQKNGVSAVKGLWEIHPVLEVSESK